MDIEKKPGPDALHIVVKGRLDGYWSGHLGQSLEESIQAGNHRVDLDLGGVDYLSSAGVRILLQFYKKLRSIKGQLRIPTASPQVRLVLETSGLDALLSGISSGQAGAETPSPGRQQRKTPRAVLEIDTPSPGSSLKLRRSGNPGKLAMGGFNESDGHPLTFSSASFGLGLGALGRDFSDCSGRFGEFLSVAGATAYLPTDGSNVPDYMMAAGGGESEIRALYALKAEGTFSHFIRFDAKPGSQGTVGLSELLSTLPGIVQGEAVGFVMIAETAGLVGARLRRSPVGCDGELFRFPAVRDWLMLTTERAHERTLCILAGVILTSPGDAWAPFVRPLTPALQGHVHAAVFPYRPLPRGVLEFQETVASVFEAEPATDLLHIFADPREPYGAGESEFWRGVLWAAPAVLEDGP